MKCQEMVDFLMAYLDGELPSAQRAAFDEHLGDCPPCIQFMESYRETVRLGKAVCASEDAEVPADAPDELIRAILAARETSD